LREIDSSLDIGINILQTAFIADACVVDGQVMREEPKTNKGKSLKF
jgi:hypothetical protein